MVLDPGSLAVLGGHFERLMGAIQGRVEQVSLVVVYPIPRRPFLFLLLLWPMGALFLNFIFFMVVVFFFSQLAGFDLEIF